MTRGAITWGPVAIWAAVLFLLSSASDVPGVGWLPIGDKVAHVGAYAVLGACLAWGRWSGESRWTHIAFLGLGVLYGLSDEWHQSFVPGRTPSLADLVADAIGITLGYTTFLSHLTRRALVRG